MSRNGNAACTPSVGPGLFVLYGVVFVMSCVCEFLLTVCLCAAIQISQDGEHTLQISIRRICHVLTNYVYRCGDFRVREQAAVLHLSENPAKQFVPRSVERRYWFLCFLKFQICHWDCHWCFA